MSDGSADFKPSKLRSDSHAKSRHHRRDSDNDPVFTEITGAHRQLNAGTNLEEEIFNNVNTQMNLQSSPAGVLTFRFRATE